MGCGVLACRAVVGDHAVDQVQVDAEHMAERAEDAADAGVACDQRLGFGLAEELAEGVGVAVGFGDGLGDPAEAAGECGGDFGFGFGGSGGARARCCG